MELLKKLKENEKGVVKKIKHLCCKNKFPARLRKSFRLKQFPTQHAFLCI